MSITTNKALLNVNEAARMLGLHRSTVVKLIQDHKLKAINVNTRGQYRMYKIPLAELHRLLEPKKPNATQ